MWLYTSTKRSFHKIAKVFALTRCFSMNCGFWREAEWNIAFDATFIIVSVLNPLWKATQITLNASLDRQWMKQWRSFTMKMIHNENALALLLHMCIPHDSDDFLSITSAIDPAKPDNEATLIVVPDAKTTQFVIISKDLSEQTSHKFERLSTQSSSSIAWKVLIAENLLLTFSFSNDCLFVDYKCEMIHERILSARGELQDWWKLFGTMRVNVQSCE